MLSPRYQTPVTGRCITQNEITWVTERKTYSRWIGQLEQGIGQDDLQRSPPTSAILDFHDILQYSTTSSLSHFSGRWLNWVQVLKQRRKWNVSCQYSTKEKYLSRRSKIQRSMWGRTSSTCKGKTSTEKEQRQHQNYHLWVIFKVSSYFRLGFC